MSFQAIYKRLMFALIIGIIIYFRRYIIASLLPFFIAFILAGLIEPAVRYFHERVRLPRSTAVVTVLVMVLIVGGYASTLITAKVLSELVDMSGQATAYQRTIIDVSTDVVNRLTEAADEELVPQPVQNALLSAIENLSERGREFTVSSIASVLGAFAALPGLLVVIVITLIATYFISKDRAFISQGLLQLAPERWREPLSTAQERIVVDMAGFLKAQFLLLVITTSVAALGLYLIGSRYWMTLALGTGLLDLIPMVGPGFLFMPWTGVSLLLGDTPLAIQLSLIYAAVFVVRQTLQPKILGDSIGAHPLLMLAALYAGIISFGVQGFIVGPLVMIIVRALMTAGLLSFPRDHEEAPALETSSLATPESAHPSDARPS